MVLGDSIALGGGQTGTITAGKEFVVGKNPGIGVNGVPGLYGSLEIGKGSITTRSPA